MGDDNKVIQLIVKEDSDLFDWTVSQDKIDYILDRIYGEEDND